MALSQKQQTIDFINTLESGKFSKEEIWSLFEVVNPTFNKSNFMFYLNAEIKHKDFTVVEKTKTTVMGISNDEFEIQDVELNITTIDPTKIDVSKFTSHSTGTKFDVIASKRKGIMPCTTYIVTGESGAGKTTICTNIADYLKENNEGFTAGFISGEMDQDDWTEEVVDNPRLGSLETIFMLDYLENTNYLSILIKALKQWNFVILDSFEVVIDQLKDTYGWTSKKAESKLIGILRQAASESGATIFAIQQYTKGGNFVGSNKIKHMLTGMAFVKFDNNGDRYIEFTKNRRGGHMVGKRLYFTKNKETGRLEFESARFEAEENVRDFKSKEKHIIENEVNEFDQLIKQKIEEELLKVENDEKINEVLELN